MMVTVVRSLLLRGLVVLELSDRHGRGIFDRSWQLEPLSPPEEGSVLEHITTGMDGRAQ